MSRKGIQINKDSIYTVTDNGKLYLNLHKGQRQVWASDKRFIAMIAGTQGGKTSFGPHWLFREIKNRGAGDYMVVTPTYKLLKLKALPEFITVFSKVLKLGEYNKSESIFYFSKEGSDMVFGESDNHDETRIIFGHAGNPESLESATAKAVWMDEAGQSGFKIGSWEALQRRLSIHQGRALITTTPYNLGWLKTEIYDPFKRAGGNHEYIDVINFESSMNPIFSKEEMERVKATLPAWKFSMFYLGQFTRPEGLIYKSFDEVEDIVEPFEIDKRYPCYVGVDFGGVNTAILIYILVEGVLYLSHEYLSGNKTIKQHVRDIQPYLTDNIYYTYGGAPSEQQWRDEFNSAGLYVKRPEVSDVEVGIDRVIQAHTMNKIKVFKTCTQYLEEKRTYMRDTDENGNVTEKIADKNTFHLMDAERYIISSINTLKLTKSDFDSILEVNKSNSMF